MNDTSEQGRKSNESSPLGKLSRMLRSMSRRFPNTSLHLTQAGFGVLRADSSYLRVESSGHWTDQDMRDFLVLFAIWLVADGARLRPPPVQLGGALLMEKRESER